MTNSLQCGLRGGHSAAAGAAGAALIEKGGEVDVGRTARAVVHNDSAGAAGFRQGSIGSGSIEMTPLAGSVKPMMQPTLKLWPVQGLVLKLLPYESTPTKM